MDALTELLSVLTDDEKKSIRTAIEAKNDEAAKEALLQSAANHEMRWGVYIFFGKNLLKLNELQQQIAEAVGVNIQQQ